MITTMKKILALLIIFIGSVTILLAQEKSNPIGKKLEAFSNQVFQEKLYVHLNRNFILAGETLWFKIYAMDAGSHQASDLSKVAYLEVLKDGRAEIQEKIELKNGTGAGSMFIPATLTSGNYMVRAYTNWMRNSSAELFFQQPITIINGFRTLEAEPSVTREPSARFFPEGGNLVSNLESKIAFTLTDGKGLPLSAKGFLLNTNNDTLTRFNTVYNGSGYFMVTPSTEQELRVVFKAGSWTSKPQKLPDVYAKGYTLSVSEKEEAILITAKSNDPASGILHLFGHNRHKPFIWETLVLQNGVAEYSILKNTLPEGISHLTLFDNNNNPLCERLWFKKPEATEAQLNISATEINTRSKVSVEVTLKNEQLSNLSLRVTQLDSLPTQPQQDITSYLYLSSELGSIQPSDLLNSDLHSKEALDILMLTHGWRRFIWKEVLNSTISQHPYVPEVRGHIITGRLTNAEGRPASGIGMYLSVTGKESNLYTSRSNAQGQVFFELAKFYGNQKLVFQTNSERDSVYRIQVNNSFHEPVDYPLAALSLSKEHEIELSKRFLSMQVQNIFYESNAKEMPGATDSSSFYGTADEIYLLDDYTRFPVMEEVMREYVKGVQVRKRKDGFHFMVMDNVNKAVFDNDPLILLDGVPVFDVDNIMKVDPLLIKKLEVFTGRYYMADLSYNGIVSYKSYKGDLAGLTLPATALQQWYAGMQNQMEFYTPHYTDDSQMNSRMPDQRTALAWVPYLITDKGNAKTEFFTSDVTGKFLIQIEGLTQDGRPVSKTQVISVGDN